MSDSESASSPQESWVQIAELLDQGASAELIDLIDTLPPSESARALSRLSPTQIRDVMKAITPERAAELVSQVGDSLAADLLAQLSPRDAADILEQVEGGRDQADLISELEQSEADPILSEMEPKEVAEAQRLNAYAEGTAGALMQARFLCFSEQQTVGDVLNDFQSHQEEYQEIPVQYLFVQDSAGRLSGVLRVHDLLLRKPNERLESFMHKDPQTVSEHATLPELRDFFRGHQYVAAPVVSGFGRLLGLVYRSDVGEAQAEQEADDHLKTQGIVGGEELRSMPMLTRSKRRLSWLSANIALNLISASMIAIYQDTLSAAITLAVFLPIISDMSGCAGFQAVAVSMRELSLGLVKPYEIGWVFFKEASLGILNGIVLGILIALTAFIWKGNPYLGLVVGAALAINTLIAVLIGGTLPLALKRIGVDPALASGPLLTTVTDMSGFFWLLALATSVLPHLSH